MQRKFSRSAAALLLLLAVPNLALACGPGEGMKPTPGGFGSWSCQPLGGGYSGGSAGGSVRQGYTGGGGGSNAAAAVGAAGAILGVLGEMATAAEQREADERAAADAEAARRAAERQAYCYENWRQASDNITRGNGATLNNNPGLAKEHFERAIALLSRCGDARNIAIARRNLEIANRQYGAVKDDDRVSDARRRFTAPNSGANPFNMRPTAQTDDDPVVHFDPAELLQKAEARCTYEPRGSAAWSQCTTSQEGRLILETDPEIKAACGIEQTPAARNTCAINAFVKKLKQQVANALAQDSCYFHKSGQPCFPGGGGAKSAGDAKSAADGLRERLRRKLEEAAKRQGRNTPVTEAEVDAAAAAEQRAAASVPPPAALQQVAQTDYNRDDPLQNFLRSGNATPGYNNAGQFDAGQKPILGLEPTLEQRRSMDELLRGDQSGPLVPR